MRYINFMNFLILTSIAFSLTYSKKLSAVNKTEILDFEPIVVNVSISIESVHFVDVRKMVCIFNLHPKIDI